jgi:hypothetical protein
MVTESDGFRSDQIEGTWGGGENASGKESE